MIISTKKGTPKEELEKIVDKFEHQGLEDVYKRQRWVRARSSGRGTRWSRPSTP